MKPHIRHGIRVGLLFGGILIFIVLIGFTITISNILGDFIGIRSPFVIGNPYGMALFIALIGLGGGMYSARDYKEYRGQAALSGFLAGLISGLMLAALSFFLGLLRAADIDLREYFFQLGPPAIRLLLYGQGPIIGSLINLAILTLFGTLGGLLDYALTHWHVREVISIQFKRLGDKLNEYQFVRTARANPNSPRVIIVISFLLVLLIPMMMGKYWNYTLGTVGIYILMGLGLNIVVGLSGLLDLGYVAFFAIGAYSVGLLTSPEPLGFQFNFWLALGLGIILAALAGILLGIPVLRLRGDYLAIVTLGFGEIIRILSRSDVLSDYVGGPQGVRDIAGPSIFGASLISERAFLYFIIVGIILLTFITIRLQNSFVGRSWVAMREDETVAQATGVNTLKAKLLAFAIGAAFAGLGGVLFASRNQYTGPEDHTLLVSINVLCLVVIGGMGSIPGVIAGAFVLKGLPEILRELNVYRYLFFGALLVVMMIWKPAGIWPLAHRRLELEKDHEEPPPDLGLDTGESSGDSDGAAAPETVNT
jgi:ABC-type branched-subunit amino acid transport system permease subunit